MVPCAKPFYVFNEVCFLVEYFDEDATDNFSLFLGISNSSQSVRKLPWHLLLLRSIPCLGRFEEPFQIHFAEQSVINKNAIEIFADGFV